MISQPIKLVGDRQEGARVQFVAWSAVDNSKIYMYAERRGRDRISCVESIDRVEKKKKEKLSPA